MTNTNLQVWLLGDNFIPKKLNKNIIKKLGITYCSRKRDTDHIINNYDNFGYAIIDTGFKPITLVKSCNIIKKLNSHYEYLKKRNVSTIRIILNIDEIAQSSISFDIKDIKHIDNINAELIITALIREKSENEFSYQELNTSAILRLYGENFFPSEIDQALSQIFYKGKSHNPNDINIRTNKPYEFGFISFDLSKETFPWKNLIDYIDLIYENYEKIQSAGADGIVIYIDTFDAPPHYIKWDPEVIHKLALMKAEIGLTCYGYKNTPQNAT